MLRMMHPPRTGGSSIRRDWMLDSEEYQSHDFPGPKGPDEWRYGFTRNPWDRVVSLYHFPPRSEPEMSFEDFVLGGFRRPKLGPRFEVTMASPTTAWLVDMDFVGRFENRGDDLARLARHLNRSVPTLHIGPSERAPYQDYFDDRTRARVAEAYAADILEFGYEF